MSDELRKALVAGSDGGQGLIAEDLEPIIRENLMVHSPLVEMLPKVPAKANVHEYRRRTANIGAWVEGELTAPSYLQSTYDRRTVEMKILRTHGKVSDFMQSAFASEGDALALEIQSATEGMGELMEYMALWGASDDTISTFTGDAYQYSGAYMSHLNDGYSASLFDVDGVVTLSDLDNALDATRNQYGALRQDPYVWLMSPGMISKISGLQTRVSRQVDSIDYEGRFTMNLYDGIPMLKSGFVKPAAATTSPAVTTAADLTTTGFLTDDEYFYQVASITLYGEQIAGTVDSTTLAGGGSTQNMDLTWTGDTTAKLYAIYRGLTTGTDNLELIDIIAAKTYSGTGAVTGLVEAYDDMTALAATYTDVQPMAAGEETVFLLNLGVARGLSQVVLSPQLGDPIADLVHFVPVAVADDTHAFRLKAYQAMQCPWGQGLATLRRVKLA